MDTPLSIPPKRYALPAFFALAFVIAWGLWIPAKLATAGLLSLPIPIALVEYVGAWGPSLAGIIVTAVQDGRTGLRLLLRRLFVGRVGVRWYLFALLWPALLSLLVTGISILLGHAAPDWARPLVVSVYPAPQEAFAAGFLPLLPFVFVIQFFGSSLGEEIGWRGFATPRLQARRSALLASAIVGIAWGLWHLPRIWTPGQPLSLVTLGWTILGLLLDAVLYAWVLNNTRGSLFPVLLLHTAQAVTDLFLSRVPNPALDNALTALLVVLVVALSGPQRLTRQRVSE